MLYLAIIITMALPAIRWSTNRNSTRINTVDLTPHPNLPNDMSGSPENIPDIPNIPTQPPELPGVICHQVNPGDTVLKILREMGYSDREALSALVTVYNYLGQQDLSRTGVPKYNRQLDNIRPGETLCTGSELPDQLPAGRGGGAPLSSLFEPSHAKQQATNQRVVQAASKQANSYQLNNS